MMVKTVFGRKVRVCNEGCQAAFRSDRLHRLIYPSVWGKRKVGEPARWYSPEEASVAFGYCVYCHATSTQQMLG